MVAIVSTRLRVVQTSNPEIVRMRRQFGAIAVLSTAAAVLSLAGCGGSSSPTSSNNASSFKSLPAAEQQQFEEVAEEEVVADVESFTSLDPLAGFFSRVVPHRTYGALAAFHSKAKGPQLNARQDGNCVTVTGDLNDEDEDGVVDADTTTENCVGSADGETDTVAGYFAFGDPTPTTADIDITDGANLTIGIASSSDGNIALTLTGSGSVNETPGTLSESGDWALNASINGNPDNDNGTFNLGAKESATYTYSGGLLTSFGTLPPGQFSMTGSWTYVIQSTSANYNLSFTISTPTALSINNTSCTANGEGIQSGEIDMTFTDGTVVALKWSNCPATPSITVS
jgi:hypothetical protein